ncbi:hypothetical protein EU534_02735 [Candidatus Heimdallarchaeota archaeon]|nr:MAG: hypothetical protein EU534_02735 [Candidatus Heimdallarchaeota archaeon]
MDTKLALDEIKLNFQRFSKNISNLIIGLASTATLLMFIFLLFSLDVFETSSAELGVLFLIPDLYTLVGLTGSLLLSAQIGNIILSSIIIILSLVFVALSVLVMNNIYQLSKNFSSLSKVDVALKSASKANIGLNIFIVLSILSIVIPSIGWIILSIFSSISLFLTFLVFNGILKQYGLRLQLTKNTLFFIGLSTIINILAVCLVFIDISFLLITVLSYIFFYFGIKRFNKHVEYIAPIVREAPPPPTIAAPVGPAPRPTLGSQKNVERKDIPSASDYL